MDQGNSLSIKHTVHDILEEGLQRAKGQLETRIRADREAKHQYPRDDGGNRNGAFAAEVLDVDGVVGHEGARDADNGGDGVVAVDDAGGGFGFAAGVGEVLREEGVEEGVAHADGGPAEPDEYGCVQVSKRCATVFGIQCCNSFRATLWEVEQSTYSSDPASWSRTMEQSAGWRIC